ncbi:MAG: SDR family NAD(P)-dependent oxidoreductase [Thermodesulfobacteriota bacterium]
MKPHPSHDQDPQVLAKTPIAIIGMSCLLPEAESIGKFWENVVSGKDCIRDVPEDRWKISDYYDPDTKAPDKTYSKRGGFIPEVSFDPLEFGLPPNILEVTDASQLLALLAAKRALMDAGYGDPDSYDRDRIGVTLGVGGGQKLYSPLTCRLQYPVWRRVMESAGIPPEQAEKVADTIKKAYIPWEENSFPGMLGNVIAGRVANRLNLGGLNCVLDAACGGALAAVRMAVSELCDRRSDIMITGGVDTDNSPFMYLCFSKTPALTPADSCSPFDENSKGIIISEGIGMLVLKRLEDAERDGDRIYAVIRGMGASSDGKFKSIYAPRPEGQAKALRRAYTDAGFSPTTVGLIEAHATGTPAGDLSEFTALRGVFEDSGAGTRSIAIGSVKSQIGHTKSAAGAAGLIKAAMALFHKTLPPTINVKKPNPKLSMEGSPFYVNTKARPWVRANGTPRRAGVSAFGFGGTNYHFVLEEHGQEDCARVKAPKRLLPLFFHAASLDGLVSRLQEAESLLTRDPACLAKLVKESAAPAIPQDAPRVGLICADSDEARQILARAAEALSQKGAEASFELCRGAFFAPRALFAGEKVCALFSGQGSQYVDMARDAALGFPQVFSSIQAMDREFLRQNGSTLSSVMFPPPAFAEAEAREQEKAITDTRCAQPAIGSVSAGLFRLFADAGLCPDFFAGHSFGELTALWAAGAVNDDDYARLAVTRGRVMGARPEGEDPGCMAAVLADGDRVKAALEGLPDVFVANENGPGQVVIAGAREALEKACAKISARGMKTVALPVSAAFHTSLVEHARAPFAEAVLQTAFGKPRAAVFSNVTAGPYPNEPKAAQEILARHLVSPVRFAEEVENLYAAGARVFVEFGPKDVLTRLVKTILGERPHLALSVNGKKPDQSERKAREAQAALAVAGIGIKDLGPGPVELYEEEKPAAGRVTVTLNGANYVSEKTRTAYTQAMAEGPFIRCGEATQAEKPKSLPLSVVAEEKAVPQSSEPHKAPRLHAVSRPSAAAHAAAAAVVMEKREEVSFMEKAAPIAEARPVTARPQAQPASGDLLSHYFSLHEKGLSAHEQYLENQLAYTRSFASLMEKMVGLAERSPGSSLPAGMDRNMELFHALQAQTLAVHGKYLDAQTSAASAALRLSAPGAEMPASFAPAVREELPAAPAFAREKSEPAPAARVIPMTRRAEAPRPAPAHAPAPAPASAPAAVPPPAPAAAAQPKAAIPQLSAILLSVVSEKTGYPESMLSLSMEMESDLGIDSIKRVEILGAMMERCPGLPEASPDELSELTTLAQVVEYLEKSAGEALPAAPQKTVQAAPLAAPAAASHALPDLTALLLTVVAEKTGYPESMLSLSMEMESDLGIDSIKRVEILGAMMERCPGLPEASPDELSELSTLAQVAEYLMKSAGVSVQPAPESRTAPVPAAAPEALPDLTALLLTVVAEKTGYPESMLSLSMEMESDLGIDSIKRVEILGAMMERCPGLPEASPEELSELSTLAQVAEYLIRSAGGPDACAPKTEESAAFLADEPETSAQTHSVRLAEIPRPDRLVFTAPEKGFCLVVSDGAELSQALCEKLAAAGIAPAALAAGYAPEKSRFPVEACASLSEEELIAALSRLEEKLGAFYGCVLALEKEQDARSLGFSLLVAKHGKKRLEGPVTGFRPFFVAAACLDGELGLCGAGPDFMAGAVFGLAKTAWTEWPDTFVRAVDLAPELSCGEKATFLLEEILDPDRRIRETGRSRTRRVTLLPEPLAVTSMPQATSEPLTYLVSGGARGVTASCVIELARREGGRFLLLGRSALAGEDPAWAAGVADSAKLKAAAAGHLSKVGEKPTPRAVEKMVREVSAGREIRETLSAIKSAGAEARYLSADVCDGAEISGKLPQALAGWGPVTGIIHGAGVLSDRFLHDKTLADFTRVFTPKVEGLFSLLSLVSPDKLRRVALFSSAAGFYGNPGQADYAMANEVLNKFAHRFQAQHPGCRVVSFNWGPWDGGMVTPELARAFAKRGISTIARQEGAAVFASALVSEQSPGAQVLVGSSMESEEAFAEMPPQFTVSRSVTVSENLFLTHHAIGENPVMPTVCVFSWLAAAGEQALPGTRFCGIGDYRLQKGVVFDGSFPGDLTLQLSRNGGKKEGLTSINARVFSKNGEKQVNHYAASVRLADSKQEPPRYAGAITPVNGGRDAGAFYEDGTLFHGPDFRSVEKLLASTPEKLTLLCRAPVIEAQRQGLFPAGRFNPYAADALFQAMLIWVRENLSAASLPTSAAGFEHYLPIRPGEPFLVSLDIRERTKTRVFADVTAHDESGRVFCRLNGAEVTVSKGLSKQFHKAG